MTTPYSYRGVSLVFFVLTIHWFHGSNRFTFQRKAYPHDCTTLSVFSPAWISLLLHGRGNAGGVPEDRQADY